METTPGLGIATLPSRKKPLDAEPSKREQALQLYEEIGARFNRHYGTSVTKAMRELLHDLRANQRVLVDGGLYTAKELDERVDQLQSHLKTGGDEGKLSMADMFSNWLNEEEAITK